MNFTSHGKLQFIRYVSNLSNHLVGTIKTWFEFFWTFTLYGGFFVGMQPQIRQFTHLEMPLHSIFVCMLFLLILSNLQVISENLQNFLTWFNPILIIWSSNITKNVVNKIGSIINLFKRRHSNGHMESSIVTKLTQMQPFYPWFFLPTNIVPQVYFQPLSHPLYFSISLGMIACSRCQICPHHLKSSCQMH